MVSNLLERNGVTKVGMKSRIEKLADFGQRVAARGNVNAARRAVSKKYGAINKAPMSENIGAQGGYLVPPELLVGVDEMLQEFGIFHHLAQFTEMTADELWYPAFDITTSQATGESPLFGGMALSWTQEGTTIAESDPTFMGGTLKANDLSGIITCSDQLVEDGGPAFGKYLESAFFRCIEFSVERECLKGNGVGKLMGLLNDPATVFNTRGGAGTIAQQDLANMVGALIPACFPRAIWVANPTTFLKIAALSSAYFINLDTAMHEKGMKNLVGYIFGRPCFVTEKLPAVGTKGDIFLFDPYMYLLARRSVEISASPHPKFTNRQTQYRIWWRGAGQLIPKGTCKLADGATTAGVAVGIAT